MSSWLFHKVNALSGPSKTAPTKTQSLESLRKQYSMPALAVVRTSVSTSGRSSPSAPATNSDADFTAAAALTTTTTTTPQVAVTGLRKANSPSHPVQQTDLFAIGSQSKAMTATTLALLLHADPDRFPLRLETPLSTLLFTAYPNIHASHAPTTLRQLATHRSGIVTYWGLRPSFALPFFDPLLDPVEARRLALTDVLTSPARNTSDPRKASFAYDNANYVLLAGIIDIVTSQPFETVIREKLWKPLGMHSACFGPLGIESDDRSVNQPWGHVPGLPGCNAVPVGWLEVRWRGMPRVLGGAGGVWCSAGDYGRWLGWVGRGACAVVGGEGDARSESNEPVERSEPSEHREPVEAEERAGSSESNNKSSAPHLPPASLKVLYTPFISPSTGDTEKGIGRYTPGGWSRPLESDHGDEEGFTLEHGGANLFTASFGRVVVRRVVDSVSGREGGELAGFGEREGGGSEGGEGGGGGGEITADCYAAMTNCSLLAAQKMVKKTVTGMQGGWLEL